MKGIVNLYKPAGISSAFAVAKTRRLLGIKAAGHMGTLDPAAEGVLLIGVGKATRLFDFFLKKEKKYKATFTFGTETDTFDATGVTVKDGGRIPSGSEVCNILGEFIGKLEQVPPAYSAKNINGKRAYEIARSGKEVVLNPSSIEIYGLEQVGSLGAAFEFDIHCSSGTYIRSLCRDIAYRLNTYAVMTRLIRTSCGPFTAENAVDFQRMESDGEKCLCSIEDALGEFPRLDIDEAYRTSLLNGIKLQNTFTKEQKFALFCGGELFGLAETNDEGFIKIKNYLRD